MEADQISLKELNENVMHQQDEANREAVPHARLVQMTYNVNRGKSSPPLEDISGYLPYPYRFQVLKQLSILEGLSNLAAKDYMRYESKLDIRVKAFFREWSDGIKHIALN